MSMSSLFRGLILFMACQAHAKKVLVLHGGDDSASDVKRQTSDLLSALGSDYEFVYGSIGNPCTGENWWADPVKKDTPTTDPDHAKPMIDKLNTILEKDGPFDGIMGYSQGGAAVAVYLSHFVTYKPIPFKWAVMFCGYVPITHTGLVDRIDDRKPFGDIPALVWMGHGDPLISNPESKALADKFKNPSIVVDTKGGHLPPTKSKATFTAVVNWIKDPSKTVTIGTPLTSTCKFFDSKSVCLGKSGCKYHDGMGCFPESVDPTAGKGDKGKDTGDKGKDTGDKGKDTGDKGKDTGDKGKDTGFECDINMSATGIAQVDIGLFAVTAAAVILNSY